MRGSVRHTALFVVGIALAVLPTKMRILLLSKDRPFCDRLRLAFAREGCALRVSDRQGIWSRSTIDDDVMLLHSANGAAAARWCRVARRVRRSGALGACCDTLGPPAPAALPDARAAHAPAP